MSNLFHEGRIKIPYRWPAGRAGSAFLKSLRDDRKFLASRCQACQLVYCPPRSLCPQCNAGLHELVPVGPAGMVVAATPESGLGLVVLDGANTAILHRVPTAGAVGRVMPLWAEDRVGSMLDVTRFEPITGRTWSETYGIPFKPAGAAPRIPQDIALVGIACTPPGADRKGWTYAEMVHEVVADLFNQTGADHSFVDTIVTASSDFMDGRTISDMAVQDVVGAPGKSASKVSMDGLFALLYAVARVSCGLFGTALVVAHAKCSEGDPRVISQAAFDPIFERPLGVTDRDALQLQTVRFVSGLTATGQGLSESIGSQPAPDADGAVALLLANADMARRLRSRRVWLAGAGFATQAPGLGDRDLADPSALEHAARQAYGQAGIQDPARDLDVAEVMDLTAFQKMLWSRGLGVERNVNPSGGAMARNPGFATGLERLAAVYGHLTESKTSGRLGLAHAHSGYVGQNHAVWIVRSE